MFYSTDNISFSNKSAQPICKSKNNIHLSQVISCYREKLAEMPVSYSLKHIKMLKDINLYKYQMTSQSWSPNGLVSPKK